MGDLDADHLRIVLALAVDAVLEAERPEVVAEAAAGNKGFGFPLEVIYLVLDERLEIEG